MSEKRKIEELNQLYSEAESCDSAIFAEQRSNILLIAGEHYTKIADKIRNRTDITPEQKIRLTQNYIQKIQKVRVNAILGAAPGVVITPSDEKEPQDKKSAELRRNIWDKAKQRYRIKEKTRQWANSFEGLGEVFVKVFWDATAGDFVGYAQDTDERGEPLVDENGEPAASDEAVFSGDFVFEEYHGFNVLRDPRAKSFAESRVIILRKMGELSELKKKYANDEEKLKFLQEEQDRTFFVFDGQKGSFSRSKGQCLIKEYYYRPSPEYPQGYYYITTEAGILEEGELPFGVFPIAMSGSEEVKTSPRYRSWIKHARPFQAEINRAGSKIAEHQISLGDDKIIMKNGSKLAQGAFFPGVRGYSVTGEDPKILAGRDGSQYLPYYNAKVAELHDAMGVKEIQAERNGSLDAYVLLFRSASQKKLFCEAIEHFEQFLIDICTIFNKLAPNYYSDYQLSQMVGLNEVQNIAEIRKKEDLGYQIKVEPMSEDVETMLGRQLVLNQALQYSAKELGASGVAKLIKSMPFGGIKTNFDDLTLDSDMADNIILALDRGEMVEVHEEDDHKYLIKRLVSRTRQPSFKLLAPQSQYAYKMVIEGLKQLAAETEAKLLRAKAGYIPVDGAMVACDLYVKDPKNPLSQKRLRVPYGALTWLVNEIERQGRSLEQLEQLSDNTQADIMNRAGIIAQGSQPGMQNSPQTRLPQEPQGALMQALQPGMVGA